MRELMKRLERLEQSGSLSERGWRVFVRFGESPDWATCGTDRMERDQREPEESFMARAKARWPEISGRVTVVYLGSNHL